jgi:CDP-paratose 2-epimerase
MKFEYVDKNREGDHICYISDLSKIRAHYPLWDLTKALPAILEEICSAWGERLGIGLPSAMATKE